MTNIFLASDIHYECLRKRTAVPVPPAADIVVLAGDISYMPSALEIAGATAKQSGLPVIFVPGNHEFYERDYEKMTELANIYEHENVHVLINRSVVVKGVLFLGTPLWAGFNAFGDQAENMKFAQNNINDFCAIKHGGKPLTTEIMLGWHEEARQFLAAELEKPFEGKTVVVTHFPPSYKLCHPRFYGKKLSNYFNANCDDLIAKYTPDAWCYGHTHSPVEKELHGVPIYCNQGGYPSEDGVGFDPERIIEIPSSLQFYDSPFHVTHDKETADEMAAKEDLVIGAKKDNPDLPDDFIRDVLDAWSELSVGSTEYQFSNDSDALCHARLKVMSKARNKAAAGFNKADFEELKGEKGQQAAMRLFYDICYEWKIQDSEECESFRINYPLDDESLIRVSRIISIYKSLHTIFNEHDQAKAWVHKSNQAFDNKTALSVMIDEPDGLERVQTYLLDQLQ